MSPPRSRLREGLSRRRWLDLARLAFGILVVAALGFALSRSWHDVRTRVAHAPVPDLLGGLAFALLAQFASGRAWFVALRGYGSQVGWRRAARIVFVGQLAKYVPGSVWAVVAQMELGRRAGVSRPAVAATYSVSLLVNIVLGALVSLICVPWLLGAGNYLWVLALLPFGLLLLHPTVLRRSLGLVLRLLRRPPLPADLSGRSIAAVAGWSLAAWGCLGGQAAILTAGLGGVGFGRMVPVAVGGYALATVAGLVIILAPAGAGVREVVLFGVLTVVVAGSVATAVVLLSRLVLTVSDLVAAGASALIERFSAAREQRSAVIRSPGPPGGG